MFGSEGSNLSHPSSGCSSTVFPIVGRMQTPSLLVTGVGFASSKIDLKSWGDRRFGVCDILSQTAGSGYSAFSSMLP